MSRSRRLLHAEEQSTVKIPLSAKNLGLKEEQIQADLVARLRSQLHRPDLGSTMIGIVSALLAVHKNDFIPENGRLAERFKDLSLAIETGSGGLTLSCDGVPKYVLNTSIEGRNLTYDVPERTRVHIAQAVRDVLIPVALSDDLSSSTYTRGLKRQLARSGFFEKNDGEYRVVVWGGHSIPPSQYTFVKEIAYLETMALHGGDRRLTHITGCGDGVMKAPPKGAIIAAQKRNALDTYAAWGFSEIGILRKEPPNAAIDHLVIWPNIEARMEAFVRSADRVRVHAGGAGTLEETVLLLGVLSHPLNQHSKVPFDIVGQKSDDYFSAFQDWLKLCTGDRFGCVRQHYSMHLVDLPSDYVQSLLRQSDVRRPTDQAWNDELFFPDEFRDSFKPSFEAIEAIDLSRDQDLWRLLAQLRRLLAAVVNVTVKRPEILTEWGDDRPKINGDGEIIRATSALLDRLAKEGRIPQPKGDSRWFRAE